MTRYEILKLNESLVRTLLGNSVNLAEVNNLAIYEDYVAMSQDGRVKTQYIVETLSEKYELSVRTIFGIVQRMRSDMMI